MGFLGFLIGFLLFIVAPGAIAMWIGTRVRRPLIAFLLTWIMTPVISLVVTIFLWPVLSALTPADNDGTGAIMLPFFGIVTGIVAGSVAALIVSRRRDMVVATSTAFDQNSAGVAKAEPIDDFERQEIAQRNLKI
jgi:hypothetical protein